MSPRLGEIFSDNILVTSHKKRSRFKRSEELESENNSRKWVGPIFLITAFFILSLRLFYLTVISHDKYKLLAQNNRVRESVIPAPRGILYDRNNIPLVRNIPAFKTASGDLYFDKQPSSPEGELQETVVREYVTGSSLAHALGYVGEVGEDKAGKPSGKKDFKGTIIDFQPGDYVGKSGVEESYDSILRGEDGKLLYEVDATGKKIRLLGKIDAVPGQSLTLSLDTELSKVAATALGDRKGAVVATIPQTGEILTLYSSPSFDPNAFIKGEGVEKLLLDPNLPLYNRAISGTYPPGSTFKIVSSIAGLESGVINKTTQFEDTGILKVGDFSFGNWYFLQYGKVEGFVDVVRALGRSNDIFFYKVAEGLGVDRLADWGRRFGMGKPLGIDIAGEAGGVMPDIEWRKRVKNAEWYLGDTYHVGIGQGDILTTPLQVNQWASIIANDGKSCKPHLMKILNSKFEIRNECTDLHFSQENIDLVKEGMRQACDTGGTGWPLFNFKVQNSKLKIDNMNYFESVESTMSAEKSVRVPVACKTGTAEYGDPQNKTHAWFTVFAPVENPQIAITVLVEGGGEGSNVAAPIAKKMLEEWFER